MIHLLNGDVVQQLAAWPAESVHCAVTSPPYWAMRSYLPDGHARKAMEIGGERTAQHYVDNIALSMEAVRRVLRTDGTLWLNIGDTYKDGEPVGIPWRVAFALRDCGWHLRQEIIWHKPNPMTETVRNRCGRAHEQIFLLSKTPHYYFDQVAIEEPVSGSAHSRGQGKPGPKDKGRQEQQIKANERYRKFNSDETLTRNKRSVWTVSVGRYKGAHFAVFPQQLIEPCILAGTSRHGVCAGCGAQWERMVKRTRVPTRPGADTKTRHLNGHANGQADAVQGNRDPSRHISIRETLGWRPTCQCGAHVARPVVLDPFGGSGTTAIVAERLGCHAILVDLHPEYAALQRERLHLSHE